MSMISELVKDLRDLEKTSEFLFGTRTEVPRVARQAADVIEDLSAKLSASNMERSSAWYGGGWIPVEERLPESNGEYLVTSGNDSVDIHADNYTDGKWWWNFWEEDDRVIAWRMLPEPYKED